MPERHTEQTRERIARGLARYHARRRAAALVRPRDLDRLRASGTVAEALRPLLDIADQEAGDIIQDLGGVEEITAMQRALVEDAVAVGLVLRAELARYVQHPDSDTASRIGSLTSTRRASLTALGLSRRARELDPHAPVDVLWGDEDEGDAEPAGEAAHHEGADDSTPRAARDRASEGDVEGGA